MGLTKYKPLLSPLRYPGSKRRLAPYIAKALELNEVFPSLFIEPFVGGASVSLQLMQRNLVDKVLLMDVDPWIASFWRVVFFDTDWLTDQILTVEVTLDKWHELKGVTPKDDRERAINCLFFNRTNFSGILREDVGPVGGKEQRSEYKIDCRFPKKTLIDRIKQISLLKDKVLDIWDCSWDEGLRRVKSEQHAGRIIRNRVFYYLDPPFFKKAKSLYRFYFQSEDHQALRDSILCLEDKWILSYDSADEVDVLYGNAIKTRTNGARKDHVELFYSLAVVSERKKGKEVVISNLEHLPPLEQAKKPEDQVVTKSSEVKTEEVKK